MENYTNGNNIPLGLGMALAENFSAMKYFASLSEQEQQQIIEQTHGFQSKEEMQAYVKKEMLDGRR